MTQPASRPGWLDVIVRRHSDYPLEPSFAMHAFFTAFLVLFPSLLLWINGLPGEAAWMKQLNTKPLFSILFGNWVCPLILWTFGASFSYLLAKRRLLVQDRRATARLSLQGPSPALMSDPSPVQLSDTLAERLERLTPGESLLSRWYHRALPGERTRFEELVIADEARMQASFALPRYSVWALPMWGLIGTVSGMSTAVSSFARAMRPPEGQLGDAGSAVLERQAEIAAALQRHLPEVTGGLASAFDATFLALTLSIPAMLLITWVEKSEEQHFLWVQDLWRREIQPGLAWKVIGDVDPGAGDATDPHALHQELRTLSDQIRALQEVMTEIHATAPDEERR